MDLTIGVDVGGTKVAAGVVDGAGRILARSKRETPARDPEAVEETLTAVVTELTKDHAVAAVGIGAAGFVDETASVVLFAPHLAWRNERLSDAVEKRVGLPVVVENDANAAAWAETRFGAARGETHVVCVTLGTGIGGGVVIDGRIYRGRFGVAGEFGHMRVVPNGVRCACGNKGCWEMYASGNALVREARDLVQSGSPLAARLAELCDGDPQRLTGPLVTRAALEGDAAAIELFEELARWLGEGLASVVCAFDPGVVVLGGGVSEVAEELLLSPTRDAFRRSLSGRGYRPEAAIRAARLGNEAGLIGAADLARRSHAGRR